VNRFPHKVHLKTYVGPKLGVFFIRGLVVNGPLIDLDMALSAVGGAAIGPEAVNQQYIAG
jgi:hypothetical protein